MISLLVSWLFTAMGKRLYSTKVIVLLGPPCVGKGHYGGMMRQEFDMPAF